MPTVKCKFCGDIIESKSLHDFKTCSCGKTFIDGGHDYTRTTPEAIIIDEKKENIQKIISLLSQHPMTETTLSKKSSIPLSELRLILGELREKELIDHMGKLVWLTSQGYKKL